MAAASSGAIPQSSLVGAAILVVSGFLIAWRSAFTSAALALGGAAS